MVEEHFSQLSKEISQMTGVNRSLQDVAEGFLRIAVDRMANAVKKISVQRGYDITQYTLNCFVWGRRATCLPSRRCFRYYSRLATSSGWGVVCVWYGACRYFSNARAIGGSAVR